MIYGLIPNMNEALSLFLQKIVHPTGFKPDYQSFAAILKSCAATADTKLGKSLHTHVVKLGHTACHLVSKALLNMYAKSNALEDCKKLFDQIPNRDAITWNILLSGFSLSRNHDTEAMRLFHEMHIGFDPKPSSVTIAIVLPICARSGALNLGKSVHCYVMKYGLHSDTLVGNALVSMYAKSGDVYEDAYHLFEEIPEKDVVSWNAMIAGFAENNFMDEAFETFRWMLKGPTAPNYATIANILPVCGLLEESVGYHLGREIHCHVLRLVELASDISVFNALLSFYSRIGRMKGAESVFQKMTVRDFVSWNTIISGFTSNNEWLWAMEFFHEFLSLDRGELDSVTLLSILPAYANLCQFQMGKQIHGYVIRHPRLQENTSVGNALLSFYSKCGDTEAAFRTFSSIYRRDLISWNSMLDAFAERNLGSRFFELLQWMHEERIKPDSVTILAIIQLCAALSRVDKVKEVHGFSIKCGFFLGDSTPTVGNAVIDAYAKCGEMEYASKIFETLSGKRNVITYNSIIFGYASSGSPNDAHRIFHNMPIRDLTTWNLMIRAYAINNCPSEALILFQELKHYGMKPDALTLMSLLTICAQMASFEFLRQCHGYVVRACFKDVHLSAALIDVYSKCGNINSANKLFQSTPQKDVVIFTAMVGGYAMHGRGEEALSVFSHMLELGEKPDHVTLTAVLSACSHTGLVSEGLRIFYSIEKMHGIKPTKEQYACLVDLLARGGRINDAYSFARKMPIEDNASVWGSLLGACRAHHQVEMGHDAANRLFQIETSDIGNYIVLSNLYAADNRWDGVLAIRKLMRTRDLKKPVGCSWIEVEKRKHVFMAGDCSHTQRSAIYRTLSILDQQIKEPLQF